MFVFAYYTYFDFSIKNVAERIECGNVIFILVRGRYYPIAMGQKKRRERILALGFFFASLAL